MKCTANVTEDKFIDLCKRYYGDGVDIDFQKKRYGQLVKDHISKFQVKDIDFFSSPGRIEICGNHTDHNNGKVICASINVDTLACVSRNNDSKIIINSSGYPDLIVDINDIKIDKNLYGDSAALVKGVLSYYKQHNYSIGGFNANITSTLFKGAGVSSSASYCLLIAEILNTYFNNNKVTFQENAKAAQYAENDYFGKPCGLMDQMAIAAGGVTYIDFKDSLKPEVNRIDWPFKDLDIVLINTGGDHTNLTNEYADIRKEMGIVANYFNKPSLRFVNEEDFYNQIPELQKINGRAILRSIHFFNENKRVAKALDAIKNKNKEVFLDCVNASGNSSSNYLQNILVNNDLYQRIPLALALTENSGISYRAKRVHGGGFMGTVLIMLDKKYSSQYVNYMKNIFGDDNVFKVDIRNSGTEKIGI